MFPIAMTYPEVARRFRCGIDAGCGIDADSLLIHRHRNSHFHAPVAGLLGRVRAGRVCHM